MLNVVRQAVVFTLLASCLCIGPHEAGAGDLVRPFVPGETLTFELSWGPIGAGTAVLHVLPMATIDGSAAYHFELKAISNPTIDRIFRIRDRLESYADVKMTHSLLFKQKLREGGYHHDSVVTFDWEKGRLTYLSDNGKPKSRPVMPGTFDPLAAVFYLRLQVFKPATQIECPITDGKKNVIGKANIVRREKVVVQNRVYDTYLVEPVLDEIELFSSDKDAVIRLWITADQKRLPVLVESYAVLGYFRAELSKVAHFHPLPAEQ